MNAKRKLNSRILKYNKHRTRKNLYERVILKGGKALFPKGKYNLYVPVSSVMFICRKKKIKEGFQEEMATICLQ